MEKVIGKINPILRGWVNYFRVGHASSCFSMVKQWVEKKVRQHLMRVFRGRHREPFSGSRMREMRLSGSMGPGTQRFWLEAVE